MNKPLKQSVRDHLDSYELTDEQLNKLASLTKQDKPVKNHQISIYSVAFAGAVITFLLTFSHPYIYG